jgi:hypothetical protein
MVKCTEQRAWKRLVLTILLSVHHDGTILTMGYNLVGNPAIDMNRWRAQLLASPSRTTRQHYQSICMTSVIIDDASNNDRRWYTRSDEIITKETILSWTTQELLAALNARMIRYTPTASRSDLEDAFLQFTLNNRDCIHVDIANTTRDDTRHHRQSTFDVLSTSVRSSLQENYSEYSDSTGTKNTGTHSDIEERLQKRAHRQQRYPTRRGGRIVNTLSNVWLTVVPSVSSNILDSTRRQTRRIGRRVTDLMLLDDDTGVRDVVRYEYTRREPENTVPHPNTHSEVVVGPGDAVEVIIVDKSHITSPTSDINGSILDDRSLYTRKRSRKREEANFSSSANIFLLPPSSIGPKKAVASVASPEERLPRKRNGDKKIYNPYGRVEGTSSNNNEKDVIDRISDFLTNTADEMFDRILVNGDIPYQYGPSESDAARVTPYSQQTFENTRRPSAQSATQHRSHTVSKDSLRRKHWKDRLEERLDSMLGLHENSDFYKSWSERYANEAHEDDGEGKEKSYDAFSVAQGRKASKRSRNPVYNKPFWEEEGNIFSLLFGRTQQLPTPPLFDRRLGFEAGSMLSIVRFTMHYVLVVASYLCRWASTQGALPQPVVVFGVGSAMLCARPQRRLFTAGIALLLLRTVGEVLHGYVYGNSGWEDDNATGESNAFMDDDTHDGGE